jgi:hypothetical protein
LLTAQPFDPADSPRELHQIRNPYTILVGKPEEKKHLGDLDLDGRIILKCILKVLIVTMSNEFI